MHKDERALEISEDLKNVIGILNMRYPNFIRGETVFNAMIATNVEYTKQRLRRDLWYLNQKGYAMFRGNQGIDIETITINGCSFALTASGFELANGLKQDKALE